MNSLETEILQTYPVFAHFDPMILQKIMGSIEVYKKSANRLCFSGNECQGFTLVLDGLLRIQYMSGNGRELTVYRVGKGDYCHLTLARLLYDKDLDFEVYSEKTMRLAIIPKSIFKSYLADNPVFLRDIYEDLHGKVNALYNVINNIGFESVESRLIAYFQGNKKLTGSSVINLTHEQIGVDIGATREAVTRSLAKMQKEGQVKLSRKKVEWLG